MTETNPEHADLDQPASGDQDWDLEASEADAAEQKTDVVESDRETAPDLEDSLEVDPADVAEQRRVVEVDEDEYR